MADVWTLPDGSEMDFQDGDYVQIDISSNPGAAYRLPFLEGYVRAYDYTTLNGVLDGPVGYTLYSVGNNPLEGVRGDRLIRKPGKYGINHGRGAHGDGATCQLCGANL